MARALCHSPPMRGKAGQRMMGWLIAAFLAYAAVVALVFVFQRSLQYFPSTDARDAAERTGGLMQTVSYRTEDGLQLSAWYRPPRDGLPTLVRFHGNGGQHGDRAGSMQPYMAGGYGVLLASYRGYGGNPGKPTEDGLYADGRAAMAWLATQGIGDGEIVLYGESLGTGVAVQLATEHTVAGLILEAPFTSAVDVGQAAYRWLPVRLLMWDRFDNLSKMGNVTVPLLLIHGEADRVISARYGRRLFEAANEPKTDLFIPGGGHSNLDFYGVAEKVLIFLGTLPGAGDG